MAIAEVWTTINSSQTDADSPVDQTLMDALRKNDVHLEAWLGLNYTAANDHNHNGVNSAEVVVTADDAIGQAQISASAVGQGELKTSTGSGSVTVSSGVRTEELLMSGGMYAFYPQVSGAQAADAHEVKIAGTATVEIISGSYQTIIILGINYAAGTDTIYYQNRYVTASGKDHWMFVKYNTVTDEIVCTWEAPDHPCYGQGADESVIKHPFGTPIIANPDEIIILVDNSIVAELMAKRTRAMPSLSKIIMEQYRLDYGAVVRPRYIEREIVEVDEQGDLEGDVVRTLSSGIEIKRRMVTGLDAEIEYRNLVLRR